jgi:hypothetical protein
VFKTAVLVAGPTIRNSAADAGYYGPHHTQFYPKFPGVEEAVASNGRVKTVVAPGVPSASSEDQGRINAVRAETSFLRQFKLQNI